MKLSVVSNRPASAILSLLPGLLLPILLVVLAPRTASAGDPALGANLTSDFKFTINNTEADAEDILTSPLRIGQAGELLRSPRFYLVVAGAGALFGGSFALDQTMRANLHNMSSSDADLLQNVSYGGVSAITGLLYVYGLYRDDARAREYALTAGMGAGLASLFTLALKSAFGRLRPRQDHHDHDAFFHGGQSFVSGDVTPMFALATGVSEYYDNRWDVAIPIYSLALLDGFGRMGHDAHWFSDVVGAALVGSLTTELLLYLHRWHAANPSRLRIFAATAPSSMIGGGPGTLMPAGVEVAYSW
jgi:membrane-associated phospholipid phosphatase